MNYRELLEKAKEVSQNAYVPYSKFKVGACVLTEDDSTFCGCNFENASYGLTICAERNAIGTAIANGQYIHQTRITVSHAELAGRL